MSAKRALRRKKQLLKRKTSIKGLKSAVKAAAGMPTTCSKCSQAFNKDSDLDSWFVVANETGLFLVCPECDKKDRNL